MLEVKTDPSGKGTHIFESRIQPEKKQRRNKPLGNHLFFFFVFCSLTHFFFLIVFHFGKFLNVGSYFSPGDDVNLNVDEEKRRLNSKLHSAGKF